MFATVLSRCQSEVDISLDRLEWLKFPEIDMCNPKALRLLNLIPIQNFDSAFGIHSGRLVHCEQIGTIGAEGTYHSGSELFVPMGVQGLFLGLRLEHLLVVDRHNRERVGGAYSIWVNF